jgi:hypothetical protein
MNRLRISKAVVVSGLPADAATLLLLPSSRRGGGRGSRVWWAARGGGGPRRGGGIQREAAAARGGGEEAGGAARLRDVARRRPAAAGWTGAETAIIGEDGKAIRLTRGSNRSQLCFSQPTTVLRSTYSRSNLLKFVLTS